MSAREVCERIYGVLQRRIVPALRDSQYVYKDAVHSHVPSSPRWLDLGCGHHCFGHWMSKEQQAVLASAAWVVGLDYEWASVRKHTGIRDKTAGDVYHLPFRSRSFDLISSNMVVEHLEKPQEALAEIARVLDDGGTFVFHTPNFHNYQFRIASLLPQGLKNTVVEFLEGRNEADVFPTAYKLNTLPAIREAALEAGLEVVQLEAVNSSAETIMLGPLVLFELLLIRLLSLERFRKHRPNIIAILRKPAGSARTGAAAAALTAQQC